MAGGDAEPMWLPGGSALLSPCPECASGALLAPAQSREMPLLPLGKGSWLVLSHPPCDAVLVIWMLVYG